MQFYVEETRERVSVNWQQVKYQLWANCVTSWNPVSNATQVSYPLGHGPPVKNDLALACAFIYTYMQIIHW